MLTKLVTLIKQFFGIIDVNAKYQRYYFDGEFWHNSRFNIKENDEFKKQKINQDNNTILIIKGKNLIDAKIAIIRSRYIRNNLSVFTLYLAHNNSKLVSCQKYKVLNHPDVKIKFINISNGVLTLKRFDDMGHILQYRKDN